MLHRHKLAREQEGRFQQASRQSLRDLYPLVVDTLKQFDEAYEPGGQEHAEMIWDAKAPSGNIYRYIGLRERHFSICNELWTELRDIAERHKALLLEAKDEEGKNEGKIEESKNSDWAAEELLRHLCAAERQSRKKSRSLTRSRSIETEEDLEKHEVLTGHPALEEFLCYKVEYLGTSLGLPVPLVVPSEPAEKNLYWRNRIIAICVFLVQVFAPLFILILRWNEKTNYFNDPKRFVSLLSWEEVTCLGPDLSSKLTTLLGTCTTTLAMFMIHNDVEKEARQGHKECVQIASLPWKICGNFANLCSCFLISVLMPITFFAETTLSSLFLDTMALFFVYKLDDLNDAVWSHMGVTEEAFKQASAMTKVLLTHCPVNLADLIDEKAISADELWRLQYDSQHNLLTSTGEVCQMRLEEVSDEKTPLAGGGSGCFIYRCQGSSWQLPTWPDYMIDLAWTVLSKLLLIFQFVFPILFFVLNDACTLEANAPQGHGNKHQTLLTEMIGLVK